MGTMTVSYPGIEPVTFLVTGGELADQPVCRCGAAKKQKKTVPLHPLLKNVQVKPSEMLES
uniref:Uncharacterized protein n=1 Tax=Anguilla anguilla TaxID=7936 RepID=A0A0E9XXA7_ANGAN